MPVLPMMPQEADQMGTSMPGSMPVQPPVQQGGGDLSSLLQGSAGPSPSPDPSGFDPMQGAMRMFDQLTQMVSDMAGMFPGSEPFAMSMMEGIDGWRQTVLTTLTPTPAQMPGAQQMM